MERQQFNVRLPNLTINQIETLAQITGVSLTQVVVEAIERMYQQEQTQMERRTVHMLEILTPQEADQVSDGIIEVLPMGDKYYKLTPMEKKQYEQAKTEGYIIHKHSSNWNSSNCYSLWCRSTGRPFVAIRKRASHATVEIEMITTASTEKLPFRVLSKNAMEQIRDLLKMHNGTGFYRFSPLFCEALNVEFDKAIDIAKQIFAVACRDISYSKDKYLGNCSLS